MSHDHQLKITCEEVSLLLSGMLAFANWIDNAPIGMADVKGKIETLNMKIIKQVKDQGHDLHLKVVKDDIQ